jgi:hypothetical protein
MTCPLVALRLRCSTTSLTWQLRKRSAFRSPAKTPAMASCTVMEDHQGLSRISDAWNRSDRLRPLPNAPTRAHGRRDAAPINVRMTTVQQIGDGG